MCATRQSIIGQRFPVVAQKRLASFIERPCIVVVDEAHHAVAPTYEKMLDFIAQGSPSLVPWDSQPPPWPAGQGMTSRLRARFPKAVIDVQVRDLVRSGLLARPITHTIDTNQVASLTSEELGQLGAGDLPSSVLRRLDLDVRKRLIVNTWISRRNTGRQR